MSSRRISVVFFRSLKASSNPSFTKVQNLPTAALARRHASGMDSITVRKSLVVTRNVFDCCCLCELFLQFFSSGQKNFVLSLGLNFFYLFISIIVPSLSCFQNSFHSSSYKVLRGASKRWPRWILRVR